MRAARKKRDRREREQKEEQQEEESKQEAESEQKVSRRKARSREGKEDSTVSNKEQKETLKKWFGTARWTYNQCLQAVEKENVAKKKKNLRGRCLNKEAFEGGGKEEENKWVLETPYDIRNEAMNDLLKAYKTNFSLQKNRTNKAFKIKFKSKKQETDSIVIHAKHWKGSGVFHPRNFGKEPILASERLPEILHYDCRLQRNRLGEYYMCISMPLEVRSENQAPQFDFDCLWKEEDQDEEQEQEQEQEEKGDEKEDSNHSMAKNQQQQQKQQRPWIEGILSRILE